MKYPYFGIMLGRDLAVPILKLLKKYPLTVKNLGQLPSEGLKGIKKSEYKSYIKSYK